MSASVSHNQTGTSQIFHRTAWWNPKNHVRNEREQTVFNPAEKHVCCGNKSKLFVSYFYYKYLWNTFTYFCKPCWFSSQLNMIYEKKQKTNRRVQKSEKLLWTFKKICIPFPTAPTQIDSPQTDWFSITIRLYLMCMVVVIRIQASLYLYIGGERYKNGEHRGNNITSAWSEAFSQT